MRLFKLFTVILLSGISSLAYAQSSEITFNVNLKPQLEDSTFVPGRDKLVLVGNLNPINGLTPYILSDATPKDSIYSIKVRFSPRFRNQILNFNFEMTTNGVKQTELMPRSVQLMGREVELDALYFNAFAW